MTMEEIIKSESNNAILRRVDELGRVVIPKEFRNRLLNEHQIVYMELIRDYIVLKVNDNTKSGTMRELDELGRLTILKENRDLLDIHTGDGLLIWTYNNYIILRKNEEKCVFCQNTKKLIKHKDKLICEKCLKTLNKMGKILIK